MKLCKLIFIAMTASLLAACASQTPYQKQERYGGGYSDLQLNKTTYKVSFTGNENTPADVVNTYLLRRAAEITSNRGYTYFIMTNEHLSDTKRNYRTPMEVQTTSNRMNANYQHTAVSVTPSRTIHYDSFRSTAIIKLVRSNKTKKRVYNAKILLKALSN